ncbi:MULTISPECIES: energy transducer TonB [Sphingomonas]|uniref:Energy transducer TonB n=1 Tax=Sphingomonas adhaesiva TaxID=28212 RepID=A0A2A4IBM0_9SPHN|nr:MULTISPECIES: energy transducer TonB [Sphingomonas]PCG15919.1 energy transducer TonB [Sphingomonas adhaesiva]PZU80746.1 MAG: energy transducer TonB [Sphingomonas sp.]
MGDAEPDQPGDDVAAVKAGGPDRRATVLEGPTSRLGQTAVPAALLTAAVALLGAIMVLAAIATHDWIERRRDLRAAQDVAATGRAPRGPSPSISKAGDELSWFSADDYPKESMRRDEQGTVTVRWTIGVDGRVSECHAAQSSGFPRLDAVSCGVLVKRARYYPARDAQGRPMVSTRERRITWRLPEG